MIIVVIIKRKKPKVHFVQAIKKSRMSEVLNVAYKVFDGYSLQTDLLMKFCAS